ncbi:MAG: putative selenium-dependent hydroxylase accessory protein YqeC [Anaerolineaceae bacterium]|nr:putative selenium-dependent hydroxylase accessory protein YqeC [Anaerolineaceae bacterium]
MKLHQAFEIVRGDVIAFIGAGGKTSTMVALAHELAGAGWRVLATTTTRIGLDQLEFMPAALPVDRDREEISEALGDYGFVFLYDQIQGDKVQGIAPGMISRLLDTIDSDVLLIEADGARGLNLKAPKSHEPVIPAETSLVVPVAGLSVLGQPLDEDHVYNAQAIDERYGFGIGNRIKSPWVAQVLRDDQLGLSGVPKRARVMVFLNQTPPNGFMRIRSRLIARLIMRVPRIQGVVMGSARSEDPVCEVQRHIGVVTLAAGMSRRMGRPKMLLPWEGRRTIVEHVIHQLHLARLTNITVVTGYYAGEITSRLMPLGVNIAYNPDYASGEMLSSLKVGLQALPPHISAALVVLGDQPRIQPRIINQILLAYAEGSGDIIAPSYQMRRGHPILIDRRYWPEILALPDDGAPRDVINAHQDRIAYVNVDNDSILGDVDTPEDYDRERRNAGL